MERCFFNVLGEQITARGIGNGISLIIFAGIVAELPVQLAQTFELWADKAPFLPRFSFSSWRWRLRSSLSWFS